MKYNGLALILCIFLSSCQFLNTEDDVIAKVGEAVLLEKDVLEAIPPGLNREDSLLFLTNFVNRWTEEQVLYQEAVNNLPEELPRINKEIEKYKRSLYIFAYENELLKAKLDTNVSKEEIETYFEENKEQFMLRQSIIKLNYMIMSNQTKNLDKLHKKFVNQDAEDLADLGKFCSTSAYECDFEDHWMSLDDTKLKIKPLANYLKTNNLNSGRVIKLEDSSLIYLLKINELKIKEDIPPLDFVKNDVKEIILNQRKSILLNSLRNEIIEESKQKNKIEVFLLDYK